MNTRLFLVQMAMILVVVNTLVADEATTAPATEATTVPKAIPAKIAEVAETVAAIKKIKKPAWTQDVVIATDRGCSISFYGEKEGLHRIRLIIGLSISNVTCDYYYSGANLVYASQQYQAVIDYVEDDEKGFRAVYKPRPKIDELRLGFTDGKLVCYSRKGDYFEGKIATLAREVLKEAKELNEIAEQDKEINLEHWQK